MFLGSFRTVFTGKNRLILPKRFRRELGNEDKFYILLGENGEIWGFDSRNWLSLTEDILKSPLSSEEGRVKRLKFFPKAEECSLDGQGRFILPEELTNNLDLGNEVIMVGAGDHFEIWDVKMWEREYGRVSSKRTA